MLIENRYVLIHALYWEVKVLQAFMVCQQIDAVVLTLKLMC